MSLEKGVAGCKLSSSGAIVLMVQSLIKNNSLSIKVIIYHSNTRGFKT